MLILGASSGNAPAPAPSSSSSRTQLSAAAAHSFRAGSASFPPPAIVQQHNRSFEMPPTIANGKICYIELPTADIKKSADFYSKVFGWQMRKRGDGATAFDDTTGEVRSEE